MFSEAELQEQLAPFLAEFTAIPADLYSRLSSYLELLLRWNARTNLTSVRNPGQIVERHFGESLFAGRVVHNRVRSGASILDLGSGAGFPGVPLQLLLPTTSVVLAESQGKKAAFLREVVRVLELPRTTVWGGRAELLAPASFDLVTLRAVDRMPEMLGVGRSLVKPAGSLLWIGPGEAGEAGQVTPVPNQLRTAIHLEQHRVFHVERT